MKARHEDHAAIVWLVNLHLPLRMLIAVDLCPRAPLVVASPGPNSLSGSFCGPYPCAFRCLAATSIDKENKARTAAVFHAVRSGNLGPTHSSVQALNDQARLMSSHEQMMRIIGIDNG